MPEDIVLKYDADPSVEPFIVPVAEGQSPADVAAAWKSSGWSLVEGADPAEIAADLAARHAVPAAAPAPADVPAPELPAEPEQTDPAPADVDHPEGN